MALYAPDVREVVERVFARQDVLDACVRRDLGVVVDVLGKHGVTQGQIAGLTGLTQGRLSEYKKRKHAPKASSTFEKFADGLAIPSAARQALGLAPDHPSASVGAQPSAALPPDVGLVYPDGIAEAAANVARLWRADLTDTRLPQARLEPGAWNDASLRWLIGRVGRADNQAGGGARIGVADVDRFRATAELFRQLDDRFGGGHARQALIQYLSTDADRMLNGRYSENVGRELFSATAEATLLAAWMSYDSAPGSSLAQRYFIQALALAQAGNDKLLGATILDAMSHQATYTGKFREAANLARAAMTGTRGIATPTLNAHFHAMEARALARLGDAKGCDAALAEAVCEFERRTPENDPDWIQYFNESELSAEFGHCLRDLGRAKDAVQYANRGLPDVNETAFARSDFFVTMVLADAHLAAGELDLACNVALRGLISGELIRSARGIGYVRDFRRRLMTVGDGGGTADFQEQAMSSRLWRIASQVAKDGA
jgi:transcriptional regulator with XRE-family HTH domain